MDRLRLRTVPREKRISQPRRSGLAGTRRGRGTTHCRPDCPGSDGGRPSAGSVPCGRRRSRPASTCELSARYPSARLCSGTLSEPRAMRGERARRGLKREHSARGGASRGQRGGSIETSMAGWLAAVTHSLLSASGLCPTSLSSRPLHLKRDLASPTTSVLLDSVNGI